MNRQTDPLSGASRPPLWRMAMYLRLSREDGDREESDSIASQRGILLDFADRDGGFLSCVEYRDDGVSGANFERPGFCRMMEDIRRGQINCVAVKDLSRFGRNYIESGNYIEQIFPFLHIRFISVNDGLDSYKNPTAMNSILIPFKNLINDEYCRDISSKTKRVLDHKRKKGEFIGAFAPYGYQKDPQNRHHLLLDTKTAPVVRNIFDWTLCGMSKRAIASRLNALGFASPWACRHGGQSCSALWAPSGIADIIRNPVYTGDMAQGKHLTISYKSHRQVKIPPEDWVVVENTHEAIVGRAVFAQALRLQSHVARASRPAKVHPLAGFLQCADCGCAMHRQKARGRNYFYCATHKKTGACSRHGIRGDRLETALLAAIQANILLLPSPAGLADRIACRTQTTGYEALLQKSLRTQERAGEKTARYRQLLYEDWKDGAVSEQEYRQIKSRYDVEEQQIVMNRAALAAELAAAEAMPENPVMACFLRERRLNGLPREVVTELIEAVRIHEDAAVTLRFRFRDPLQNDGGVSPEKGHGARSKCQEPPS